jgi:membrane associated rhomboid family serine protease
MFPIGDDNSDRERWPLVTTGLILLNVVIFLYELSLEGRDPYLLAELIHKWGAIPREYALGRDLPPRIGLPYWSTLFTSMFLHGGWGHLLGNMLYLWIFGDNVEDRFGRVPFVLFYLAAGVAGAVAQIVASGPSPLPTVGASGAISGVLGAYVFMFPRKRVRVILFVFIVEVPALVVIGLWALTQFVSGFGSLGAQVSSDSGGVAYLAHVGGFIAGVLGAAAWKLFAGVPERRLPPRRGPWDDGPYGRY